MSEKIKRVDKLTWILLFLVSLRSISHLILSLYYITLGSLEASLLFSVAFVTYTFCLIGLVKNYRWSYLVILLVSLIDMMIAYFYETFDASIFGAIVGDFILASLSIAAYNKKLNIKLEKKGLDKLSKILGAISCFLLFSEISSLIVPTSVLHYTLIDIFLILGLGYVIYKAFIKKVNLSTIDKLFSAFLILFPFLSSMTLNYSYQENLTRNQNLFPYFPRPTTQSVTYYLFDNITTTIPPESYYVYPIELGENMRVRFVVISTNNGVFNTLLLNSTEYDKLTNQEEDIIYYYVNSYNSGVKKADVEVIVDNNDTYYFIVSTTPILRGQAIYAYPTDIVLTVYISE